MAGLGNPEKPMIERYPRALVLLHWLMVPLMIAAFVIGEMLEDLPNGPDKLATLGWHVLVGLTVAVLVVPRMLIRLRGVPVLPEATPPWQALLAKVVHLMLYATMLMLPVLGLIAVLTGNRGVPVPGLFELPSVAPIRWLHGATEDIHSVVAKIFLVALLLHVAAALWHVIVRRDGLAARMIPFLQR
jgi:cytochrome b561